VPIEAPSAGSHQAPPHTVKQPDRRHTPCDWPTR